MIILQKYLRVENNKMRTKNKIISGIVNEARHTFRITVSDSLYKTIKYHAVDRNLKLSAAAEDMLERLVKKPLVVFDPRAENQEQNRINNVEYLLNAVKENVRNSLSLITNSENYSQQAESFISFLDSLLINPVLCFTSGNRTRIEKECTAMLLAAYDAARKANLAVFPLYESYFYELLRCCKNKYSDEDKGAKKR